MELVYKNLKANFERLVVTDEEIDRQLARLQQQTPRITPVVGRPAQNGDEVVLDYAGFCDGEQFEGGTAERQTLTLGSGMFIPGFEQQLMGANIGEDVTVRVTFPTEYHAPALAGKEAEFRCKIHEIRTKSVYELDDVFAREVGHCDTYAEMRMTMAESLRAFYDDRAEMELQDKLIRQAAMTLDYTPTAEELEQAVEAQMQTLQAQLGQKGLSLEAYCQFSGSTPEQLREDAKPEAEYSLRVQKTAEKIADLEHITVEDSDIAVELAAICRQNGMTMEQLRPYINEEFETAVKKNIRMKKAIRRVRELADVTEITVGGEKK